MASTDIDGSIIVILSAEEAHCIYNRLYEVAWVTGVDNLSQTDRAIFNKIAYNLDLPLLPRTQT
jgi:hypothetical protein